MPVSYYCKRLRIERKPEVLNLPLDNAATKQVIKSALANS